MNKDRLYGIGYPVDTVCRINPEDHLRLVCSIASKYIPKGTPVVDTDEYAEGVIALIKAAQKYNPEKHKTEFSTYAYPCIQSAIISMWRGDNRKKRANESVSLDEDSILVFENHEEPVNYVELTAKFLERHEDDDEKDIRNKHVVYEHYILGKTWQKIADEIGVSKPCAQQYGVAGIALLQKRFANTID